jgi:aryl-alcohol dehydrogenase-like predicted oxidoreductase
MPGLDDYITLGRSGLRVSPLCLGTMTFGLDWGWGSTPEDSHAILNAYLERGGNFLDTANMYTKGHSEKIIGDFMRARGAHQVCRDRVVIATKFCGNMFQGDPNAGGASRKAIHDQLHHSLRRLQTDYIDLYWMHFNDPNTPIDETMRALDDLVRAGKIRYIGFSDTPAWVVARAQTMAEFRNWSPLIALQIEYSLLERTVEGDLIPAARELGLGVTPWSPLKGGLLTGKYTRNSKPKEGQSRAASKELDERTLTVIDALLDVSRKVGASPAAVALAWARQRPGVTSTIIGARTMDQLDANLASLDVTLPGDAMDALNAASKPTLPFPHAFLDNVRTVMQAGTSVNGVRRDPWPLAPASDDERY